MLRLPRCMILILLAFSLCAVSQCAVPTKSKTKPKPPATTTRVPANAKDYTQADYAKGRLAFCRRVIVDSYRAVGERSEKWDAASVKFLEAYAKLSAEQTAPDDDLAKQAETLANSGCTDPLVLSCCGMTLDLNSQLNDALAPLNRSLDGFEKSKYPKCRAAVAAIRYQDLLDKRGYLNQSESDRLTGLTVKWTVASLSDGSFKPDEQRLAAEFVLLMADMLRGRSKELWSELPKCKHLDPWVSNYLNGWREIDLAWAARGNDYAYAVKDEGWKGFEKHLNLARPLLVAAWKLHPNYPEAPTRMIQIAMAGYAGKGETTRLWFDRAIAGQIDYMPAYKQYRWALRPRWGGSLGELYEFGVECLKARRFDTLIPWEFASALSDVTEDLQGDARYYKKPETWPRLRILCEGYAKAAGAGAITTLSPSQWRTVEAAFAARCGKYVDAAQILTSISDRVDSALFSQYYPAEGANGMGLVMGLGGRYAAQITRAGKLRDTEAYSKALDAYEELLTQAKGDQYLRPYVQDQIEAVGWQKAFAEGKWVNLTVRPGSSNWTCQAGMYEVEKDGTISLTPSTSGQKLLCNVSFGDRYEIKGELEFGPKKSEPLVSGLLLYSGAYPRDIAFCQDLKTVIAADYMDNPLSMKPAGVKPDNTFLVQQYDDCVNVYLNDKQVLDHQKLRRALPAENPSRVGIGGDMRMAGSVVKYRNLQIRRLTEQP